MILKFGVKVVKHILDDFTIIFDELQILQLSNIKIVTNYSLPSKPLFFTILATTKLDEVLLKHIVST